MALSALYLITLKEAKDHLKVDHDSDDDDIRKKMGQASDIVIDYCKVDVDSTTFHWCDDSGEPDEVPRHVKAATFLVLGALYENRDGDAWRSPQPLSQAVIDLLHRTRDPAMA